MYNMKLKVCKIVFIYISILLNIILLLFILWFYFPLSRNLKLIGVRLYHNMGEIKKDDSQIIDFGTKVILSDSTIWKQIDYGFPSYDKKGVKKLIIDTFKGWNLKEDVETTSSLYLKFITNHFQSNNIIYNKGNIIHWRGVISIYSDIAEARMKYVYEGLVMDYPEGEDYWLSFWPKETW